MRLRESKDTPKNETPEAGPFGGFSIPNFKRKGLNPQAGYRLIVAIQPFTDVMDRYTCRNSNKE